jgi:hypothetical protein
MREEAPNIAMGILPGIFGRPSSAEQDQMVGQALRLSPPEEYHRQLSPGIWLGNWWEHNGDTITSTEQLFPNEAQAT